MKQQKELFFTAKNFLLLLLLANLLLFIDQLFLPFILPFQIYSAFTFLLILFISIHSRSAVAIILISLIGLSYDLYTGLILGPGMFAAIVLNLVYSILASALYINSSFVLVVLGFLTVILFQVLLFLYQWVFSLGAHWTMAGLLESAILTAILTPFLFKLQRHWFLRR